MLYLWWWSRNAPTTIFRMEEETLNGRQARRAAWASDRQTYWQRLSWTIWWTLSSTAALVNTLSIGEYCLAVAAVNAMHEPSSCRATGWQTDRSYRQTDRQTEAGCLTAARLLTPSCFPARSAWQKINDAALSWRRAVAAEKGEDDPVRLNSHVCLFTYTA